MTRGELQRLLPLAAMARDAELQMLGGLASRISGLTAQAARLRADRTARDRDRALDPARLSGADIAWSRWCDSRLAELQRRLAELEVERATHLAAAQRAFGRGRVLEQLVDRQK